MSAQRLSASWKVAEHPPARSRQCPRVLNACRRHGRSRSTLREARHYEKLGCSTPVGVMEGRGANHLANDEGVIACSTPVGVMEGRGDRQDDVALFNDRCSTPVGVMEGRGRNKGHRGTLLVVLNACR